MIETLEQRKAIAAKLLRIKADSMVSCELDMAMALLLHKTIQNDNASTESVMVLKDDDYVIFSPTTDWADYGEVISNVQLVTGSHAMHEDASDTDRVTGHWYSCHGFYGGVKAEGYDVRDVVGRTCALLLEHNVKYGRDWGNY